MSGAQAAGPLSSADMSVKLYVTDDSVVRPEELVPVFHRWIKEGVLEDELQIDVAVYEHVPQGPGIVLICNTAHYYFDVRGNRWGLRYRGRREAKATGEAGIAAAFRSALRATALIESEPSLEGRIRFRTDEFEFGIYDRLRAPSDAATLAEVQPALEGYVKGLYGADAKVELASGPKEPFMLAVSVGASPTVEELLGQVVAVGA